jgi:hypothetical protein
LADTGRPLVRSGFLFGVVQVQKVADLFIDPLKEAVAKTIELSNL